MGSVTNEDLDRAIVMRFHEMFFDGENASEGSRLIAAMVWKFLRLAPAAQHLPRATRAVKGWRRLAPARSLLPLPWTLACLIASYMMSRGWIVDAARTILCFGLYLRPSEALRICNRDVTPPNVHGGAHTRRWAITLHPREGETPSKTGQFDESLVVDNPEYGCLIDILRRYHLPAVPTAQLLPGSYPEWTARFREAALATGQEVLGPPVLYQLRHGGASHEMLTGSRGIADLKKRMRHASDSSVRRYEKGGRLHQQLGRVAVPVQRTAARAALHIGGILTGRVPPIVQA